MRILQLFLLALLTGLVLGACDGDSSGSSARAEADAGSEIAADADTESDASGNTTSSDDTETAGSDAVVESDVAEADWAVTSYECTRGGGGGGGGGPLPAEARDDIDFLFAHVATISRHVEWIAGGVETTTTSSDPEVAGALQRHVAAMEARLSAGQGVRMWDPIFSTVAGNDDLMSLEAEPIDGGVHVLNTGEGELGAKLARAHAEVVSRFVLNGHDEAQLCHDLNEP